MHPGHQPDASQQVHQRLKALADELVSTKRRIDQVHGDLACYWADLLAVHLQRASMASTIGRLKGEQQRRKQLIATYSRSNARRGGTSRIPPA
jgi:septal ring factor EnvC (AmiA/AmiB activator)